MRKTFVIYYKKLCPGEIPEANGDFIYYSIPAEAVEILPDDPKMIFVGVSNTEEERLLIISKHMLNTFFYDKDSPLRYFPN